MTCQKTLLAIAACLIPWLPALGQLELPSPTDSMAIGDPIVDSGFVAPVGFDAPATGQIVTDAPIVAGGPMLSSDGSIPAPNQPEFYSGDVFPEATWMNPTTWLSGPYWEKGIELGINGSEGNAQAFSMMTAGRLRRETDRSIWGVDIVYAKTEAQDVLTQHYAFLNSRLDYKLGDSRWSLFNITRLEYDEFKAFDLRLALNGGIGYDFIRTDTRKLTGRFGAGASREFGGSDDSWVPEAVFGADYIHKLSDRQRLAITSDYYPSWADFMDYRLVSQASWELLLDEETNLSLKIGVLDRYDSTPMGLQHNDLDYFITLLWKM